MASVGRKGFKAEFEAACMLGQSAGVLIDAQNRPEKYTNDEGRIKIDVAKTVFLKLAPSKVEVKSDIVAQIKHYIEKVDLEERAKSFNDKLCPGNRLN